MKYKHILSLSVIMLLLPLSSSAAGKAVHTSLVRVKVQAKIVAKKTSKTKLDLNCGDFATWQEAQSVFEQNGGVKNDIYRLDADKDGIACEELKK